MAQTAPRLVMISPQVMSSSSKTFWMMRRSSASMRPSFSPILMSERISSSVTLSVFSADPNGIMTSLTELFRSHTSGEATRARKWIGIAEFNATNDV